MGLRKGQKELVEQYRGGYCAVPAIPGGGKTHCLSLWAAEMIAQGLHKPGKILIVTYMNSAVNNFKQRISKELASRGISGNKDYFVSTIHGLCLQIIKEKPDVAGAAEEFEIVDGVTKLNLVSDSINEWKTLNEDRFRHFIEETHLTSNRVAEICKNWQDRLCTVVQTAIADFKCRGINPMQAKGRCSNLPGYSLLKCSAEIYEIFERKLRIGGLLDFDDMLYNARKMLSEDRQLLEKYQNRYTFVCEDEAQDSNLIQSEILSLIAQGNLLRVGDSNQAICGSFTNSDFKFFKEFCELPETTVYNITQSSRNTRDIIDLANYFVRYVRECHPVQPCCDSLLPQYIEPVDANDPRLNPETPEYGIKLKIFNSWEEETTAVIVQAQHMVRKYPDKTIAVLAPTSRKIEDLVRLMEARGIQFEELDNTAKERNAVLRKLGRVVDFIASPENGQKLGEMFFECFFKEKQESSAESAQLPQILKNNVVKEQLLEFLKNCLVEKILYPGDDVTDALGVPEIIKDSGLWNDFLQSLGVVRGILEYPLMPIERLILFIADRLSFGSEEKAIAHKVADDARYMKQQNLQFRLSDLAVELLSPRNAFTYFTGVVWDLKGYEPRPGVVTVCTYHKSKGLEWDTVFLTGLNYADFPVELNDKFIGEYWFLKPEYKNPQALLKAEMEKLMEGNVKEDSILASKIETISEKARLLYVGITRAKQYLYLSGFHANPGKKNEAPASKYLIELKRYIDQASESKKKR